MKYLQILSNCSGDISTCCSNYGLARFLSIIKQVVNLIHIIVPIILLVMLSVQLTKMVMNPDEKKNMKALYNKLISTVIVFFLPMMMNIVLGMLPSSFEMQACWNSGDSVNEISMTSKSVYISKNNKKKYNILINPEDYEKGDAKHESSSSSTSNSTGNGTILLIAGHSYPPYCNGSPNDCRGKLSTGYDETDQTRDLVKLIKNALDSINVKSDIANALMAGDNDTMNKSFYIECRNNSALCNKYDWSKYKFVLEIHFNASNGSAAGSMLVKKTSSYSTPADKAIMDAVTKNTGQRQYSDYIFGAHNIGYFMSRNVPITYLETEFYDNKSAMDIYSSKKGQIAKDIAAAIKQYYG